MRKFRWEKNRAYTLGNTVFSGFRAVFSSTLALLRTALGKHASPIIENRFFEILHFLLASWPQSFWKKPSGIKAGRSVGTFLHFLLEREARFKETKSGKGGFTLIETMVAVILLSIIFISAFQSLGEIQWFRARVTKKLDLWQDLHYNVERLVELIKNGGSIDYEEYFNRRVVGTGTTNGHFSIPTGFGNYGSGGIIGTSFWAGPYLCLSGNENTMGTDGCFATVRNSQGGVQTGIFQRYGAYLLQFIDYNSDANDDAGDPDGTGGIAGDEDDENLGVGPETFAINEGVKELYLVKKSGVVPERLLLRRTVILDPRAPSGSMCDIVTATGSGCLGHLEMLRLVGRDYGEAHTGTIALSSTGRFDGKTDTWECRNDFHCFGPENTPTGGNTEWVSVFPESINVVGAEFFLSPNKDPKLAWKDPSPSVQTAPQVRIALTLGFSWERRRSSASYENQQTSIVTTVSLSP